MELLSFYHFFKKVTITDIWQSPNAPLDFEDTWSELEFKRKLDFS